MFFSSSWFLRWMDEGKTLWIGIVDCECGLKRFAHFVWALYFGLLGGGKGF